MTPGRGPRRATGAAFVVLVLLLAAACGGPTGSLDPGDSAVFESPSSLASASGSAGSASPSSTVTDEPSPSATPIRSTGSGSLSAGLCDLLPAADLETALNVGGIAARAEQGDATAGSCTYLVGDRAVAATTLLARGAAQVFDTYVGIGVPVAGIGDAAIWIQANLTLFVRKGDRLFGIQLVAAGPVAPEDARDACIALGRTAAGRF